VFPRLPAGFEKHVERLFFALRPFIRLPASRLQFLPAWPLRGAFRCGGILFPPLARPTR